MPDIKHVFHIDAPKDKVFSQLTTRDGLAKWWTEDTVGEAGLGGELAFSFNGNLLCKMKVMEAESPEKLVWECVEGYPDWVGTQVVYELSENEGKTKVHFGHNGWETQDDFYAQCNFSWGRYMVSLRDLCEKGQGDPWPAHK